MTAKVETWADNFGNWHALVTGVTRDGGRESAYMAIRDIRVNRSMYFNQDRFSVSLVFENGEQTEWVEHWEGEGIPTHSDVVTCSRCGKSFPPNVAPSARCPFEYEHEENREDDESADDDEIAIRVTMNLSDARKAEGYLTGHANSLADTLPELSEALRRVAADIANARIAAGF
jgi:hypothetical protein